MRELSIRATKEGFVFLPSGYKTKGYLDVNGYRYITPIIESKKVNLKVHRVVAVNFIPNPLNKKFINHKDGNKSNNKVSNLEWVTASENMKHAVKMGLCTNSSKKGEKHNTSKHTDAEVFEIRYLYSLGIYTMRKLASKFNTSSGYVSDVINNKIRT